MAVPEQGASSPACPDVTGGGGAHERVAVVSGAVVFLWRVGLWVFTEGLVSFVALFSRDFVFICYFCICLKS